MIIRLLLFALFAWLVFYIIRSLFGGAARPNLKCTSCRYFGGADEEGVFCSSGDVPKFKTLDDVEKCLDHARPG